MPSADYISELIKPLCFRSQVCFEDSLVCCGYKLAGGAFQCANME